MSVTGGAIVNAVYVNDLFLSTLLGTNAVEDSTTDHTTVSDGGEVSQRIPDWVLALRRMDFATFGRRPESVRPLAGSVELDVASAYAVVSQVNGNLLDNDDLPALESVAGSSDDDDDDVAGLHTVSGYVPDDDHADYGYQEMTDIGWDSSAAQALNPAEICPATSWAEVSFNEPVARKFSIVVDTSSTVSYIVEMQGPEIFNASLFASNISEPTAPVVVPA